MSKIKLLSDDIINQIAAGEIITGPHSALKELVENSIDASAKNIEIYLKDGGMSKIVVSDDGIGMDREDLLMSLKRHSTSKLNQNNLFEIYTYGFRGEAIPSIASVSNFILESESNGISVNFGDISEIYPSNINIGTRVSITNLFSKIPARLKFMKSISTEFSKCIRVIENFALTTPDINFLVRNDQKLIVSYCKNSLENRISQIYTKNIFEKGIYFEESSKNIKAWGYLFHPSHSKYSSSNSVRLFVNNRIVSNKMVNTAVKIGYRNIIDNMRYPLAILYIEIDPFFIDINISPTKSDVRFRDESTVQRFIIDVVSKNIQKFNRIALDFSFFEKSKEEKETNIDFSASFPEKELGIVQNNTNVIDIKSPNRSFETSNVYDEKTVENVINTKKPQFFEENINFFGKVIGQIFDTYIISYNEISKEVFIIDQHAVHEKMTMNKKLDNADNNIQYFIKPEVINIPHLIDNEIKDTIEKYGFRIDIILSKDCETLGTNALDVCLSSTNSMVIVNAIPGIMNKEEAFNLINDVLDGKNNCEKEEYIRTRIADISCHNSIRAGRKLSQNEMTQFLEDMEKTKDVHQCNHHRPSFLVINRNTLEKEFERT
ncbi:MAG: DNA mismatch repair endonuclease MutL [Holosporales bacterium]|nr:DNA mismatch repair endonuclease MutL [Holosporales bacterium]